MRRPLTSTGTSPGPASGTGPTPDRAGVPGPRIGPAGGWLAAARGYWRSRRGGAMLIASTFVLIIMSGVGGMAMDYAWRETQWSEIRMATKAAIAAAGELLDDPVRNTAAIQRAVSAFLGGAVPGLAVAPQNVDVDYDAATNSTLVVVRGTYSFDRIWGGDSAPEPVAAGERVTFSGGRHEVAVAVDVSGSMWFDIPSTTGGPPIKKVHAVANALDVLGQLFRTNGANVQIAVVPYGAAVNTADLCGFTASTTCPGFETRDKRTFIRLLMGQNGTISAALARGARDRNRQIGGHWVDTFHSYGTGTRPNNLARRYHPATYRSGGQNRQWHIRDTGLRMRMDQGGGRDYYGENDPVTGTHSHPRWEHDDIDFWSGCVMARWGAYWWEDPRNVYANVNARPANWDADDPDNWPVKQAVDAWNADLPALPADTPLHLSDAPPHGRYPHTLFTAYSNPDGRIAGTADWARFGTLALMLDDGVLEGGTDLADRPLTHDNDWSLPGGGGDAGCPKPAIYPLSPYLGGLQDFTSIYLREDHSVFAVPGGAEPRDINRGTPGNAVPSGNFGHTLTHLGIVWSLRVLSPLWQRTWEATSTTGPQFPCDGQGGPAGCVPGLTKSIVLVADGQTNFSQFRPSRLLHDPNPNDDWHAPLIYNRDPICTIVPGWDSASAIGLQAYFRRAGWWKMVAEHGFPDYWDLRFRQPLLQDMSDCCPSVITTSTPDFVELDGTFSMEGRRRFAEAYLMFGQGTAYGTVNTSPWGSFNTRVDAIMALLDMVGQQGYTAHEILRGLDTDMVNMLSHKDPFGDRTPNPFQWQGRLTRMGGYCDHEMTAFSPYGRVNDPVYIGRHSQTIDVPDASVWYSDRARVLAAVHPGVHGVSPFQEATFGPGTGLTTDEENAALVGGWPTLSGDPHARRNVHRGRTVQWLYDACRIANLRGVRIHALFVGNRQNALGATELEQCVDAAGGDPGVVDVVNASTDQEVVEGLSSFFRQGNRLRFLPI